MVDLSGSYSHSYQTNILLVLRLKGLYHTMKEVRYLVFMFVGALEVGLWWIAQYNNFGSYGGVPRGFPSIILPIFLTILICVYTFIYVIDNWNKC